MSSYLTGNDANYVPINKYTFNIAQMKSSAMFEFNYHYQCIDGKR